MTHKKYELFGELNWKQIVPFALIACCYMLWGFANDLTSAMNISFAKVFLISTSEAGLINVATYLGYLLMAVPAAIIIRKHHFKTGVLVGLVVFAVGSLLFLPAEYIGVFSPFLFAYFVMTCGSAILETSCNPMVYCMGSEESGIGRLNLAQAFNALGALLGMFVVRDVVLAGLSPLSTEIRQALPAVQFNVVKTHDLGILIQPYIFISAFVALLLVGVRLQEMKLLNDSDHGNTVMQELRDILRISNYREAVITQFFYVGGQICCWAFIIPYGLRIFLAEGMSEQEAEMLAQKYNIAALLMFTAGRFFFSWLLRYLSAGRMLSVMGITAAVLTSGVALFTDRNGLYCLIIISGCMSMMFATIYGMGLRGMGRNIKLASAGMTMSVFGGAFFPILQALIIDSGVTVFGLPPSNISFIVPLICFIVVALYGHSGYVRHNITHNYHE